jgi:hypothetical protein
MQSEHEELKTNIREPIFLRQAKINVSPHMVAGDFCDVVNPLLLGLCLKNEAI